jgi:hypothetical protein
VCRACGTEIRPTARFCDTCGAPVAAPERSAPTRPDPRAYTPKHLAERILTSRGAIEGERKQVTVFFADVTGSIRPDEPLRRKNGYWRSQGIAGVLSRLRESPHGGATLVRLQTYEVDAAKRLLRFRRLGQLERRLATEAV